MADNVLVDNGAEADYTCAAELLTINGTSALVQQLKLISGAAGATAGIPGDSTNGLWVNVKTAATITADTELPAAATLTDGIANPSTPQVGADNMVWNGTTWDRVKGDATNGMYVNIKAAVDQVATGKAATDAAVAGNPVYIAGKSSDVTPAAMSADGRATPMAMTREGAVYVANEKGGASTKKTPVTGTTTSVTILASNTARKGCCFVNNSTAILYIDTSGGTASATSWTRRLYPNETLTLPDHGQPMVTNAITGIWASATGDVHVEEID